LQWVSLQDVCIGDLELFCAVDDKNVNVFYAYKTHNMIMCLLYNVIKTCLCNISISYSCISLRDVASKLNLDSTIIIVDVENIVTKAIWDGGINVSIDHSKGWM
jgi:26S proteasome regulatory subunit N3